MTTDTDPILAALGGSIPAAREMVQRLYKIHLGPRWDAACDLALAQLDAMERPAAVQATGSCAECERLAKEIESLGPVHQELGRIIADLRAKLAEAEAAKNTAYSERDRVVQALSCAFPSYLCRHQESDTGWENDWRWIVTVDLPTGQAAWHIHDSERAWFQHLPVRDNQWDGHTTPQKHERIDRLAEAAKPDDGDEAKEGDERMGDWPFADYEKAYSPLMATPLETAVYHLCRRALRGAK